jgi:hypothetical protein
MEKVPDPRVKEQERLPLPVPKIGQEYMKVRAQGLLGLRV